MSSGRPAERAADDCPDPHTEPHGTEPATPGAEGPQGRPVRPCRRRPPWASQAVGISRTAEARVSRLALVEGPVRGPRRGGGAPRMRGSVRRPAGDVRSAVEEAPRHENAPRDKGRKAAPPSGRAVPWPSRPDRGADRRGAGRRMRVGDLHGGRYGAHRFRYRTPVPVPVAAHALAPVPDRPPPVARPRSRPAADLALERNAEGPPSSRNYWTTGARCSAAFPHERLPRVCGVALGRAAPPRSRQKFSAVLSVRLARITQSLANVVDQATRLPCQ